MSTWERDVLKTMAPVLSGRRTQREAARLLKLSERQVRRIQRKLEVGGDGSLVHGLRGRPSNRRIDDAVRHEALRLYRRHYLGFGPTMASEKLAWEHDVPVAVRTLREWLLAEGLWQRKRRRDRHRSRRRRRECFGEMLQADASEHNWLQGRGPMLTLVGVIDDATGRTLCRFHPAETTKAYMDVLWRWIDEHGRPMSWYCDRHSIFRAEERLPGAEKVSVSTQFSRALEELGIELILANSPQAKGRIERLWGTAQDRLVKELRLAGARTLEEANRVLEEKFLPWLNENCTKAPASGNDAHRALDEAHKLEVILSVQTKRHVANDYTIRHESRIYQLLPPVYPGERKGWAIVEERLDGSMRIRFKEHYLEYKDLTGGGGISLADDPIPAEGEGPGPAAEATGPGAVHRADGPSGRTAALPYHPAGGGCGRGKNGWRPASNHPWRKNRKVA